MHPSPLRAAAGLALLATMAAAPARAQSRTLTIRDFHADITIRHDGSMTVAERLRIRFQGSWNGIYRWIPVQYETPQHLNYKLRLRMQEITDQAGHPLRYESKRSGGNRIFKIWVPNAANATRTILLRYRVSNGLRFFDDHDELYWNVTGTDTQYPIESASAQVLLPPEIQGMRTGAYTGSYGATGSDATISQTANLIDYRTTRPLKYREGLTIVAGWDPGVVHRPTPLERAEAFLISNWLLAIPLLAFGLMLFLWQRFGRDPTPHAIVPRYEPPEGLTPAEAGTLIDDSPDLRDITASIVDLAVRGFLVIEETTRERVLGLFSSHGYGFRSLRPYADWRSLRPHERKLLSALFDAGDRDYVQTSDLQNSFYKHLPGIKSELSSLLVAGGYYRHNPTTTRLTFIGVAIAVGVFVTIGGGALTATLLGEAPLSAIMAGILTALVIGGFGLLMPARTVRGARLREAILGFEEFLNRVESDRFARVVKTPDMFEKFLPFAMAFGVERSWARAFDDIYRTPPQWYRGSNMNVFACQALTSDLAHMSSLTGSAMTSAPRSSSGSSGFGGGFGGGGFSGGGFGGGGVGGF